MALVKCNASFSYPTAGGPRTIAVGELLDESDPAVTARRSFFSPTTAEAITQTAGLADGSVTASKLAADALAAAVAAGASTYGPLPVGTPTVGQAVVVTDDSPLTLGYGSAGSGSSPTVTASKTARYLGVVGEVIPVDASGGSVVVDLPPSATAGQVVTIVRTDSAYSNPVILSAPSGQTVDGAGRAITNGRGVAITAMRMEGVAWRTTAGGIADPVEGYVVPPAAVAAYNTSESTWFNANDTIINRFMLEAPITPEAVRVGCGIASGNMEVAIGSLTKFAAETFRWTKLFSTGVVPVPTPTANSIRLSFVNPIQLPPGLYGATLWCDNATATFQNGITNAALRNGIGMSMGAYGSGVPGSSDTSRSGRFWGGCIEGATWTLQDVVLMGDSITANQTWWTSANLSAITATGRFRRPYNLAHNGGIAGNTTTQMLARIAAEIAYHGKIVHILGGSNDIPGADSATTINNLGSMITQFLADGSDVVIGTVPPRWNSSQSDPLTAPMVAALTAVNTWIRAQAATRVKVAEYAIPMSTGDGITPNATYFADQVHPSAAGQALMASVLVGCI